MGKITTRTAIIEAADRLFYQRGFEATSFSDIAEIVKISRGNFYHHFKTKDEILDAVISNRLVMTQQLLHTWDAEGATPEERIRRFIHILIANWDKISAFGCPVGTLNTELVKLEHAEQPHALKLFSLFRSWLCHQFELLGHDAAAVELSMHLLARTQGVATVASAFNDEKFVRHEVQLMCDWLTSFADAASSGEKNVGNH